MSKNITEGAEQHQEFWPCTISQSRGESFYTSSEWLMPVVVAVLELEHPEAVSAEQREPSGGSLQIVYTSASYVIGGITWQQMIQAHVQQLAADLAPHLEYRSDHFYFIASSNRITYIRRLAQIISTLIQDAARIRELLLELGRADILQMIPVRNLPGSSGSIGVKKPEANEGEENSQVSDAVGADCLRIAESDKVEVLAKLAYEVYMADAYRDGSTFLWERLNPGQRQHWRASAQAVMNHVLQHIKP